MSALDSSCSVSLVNIPAYLPICTTIMNRIVKKANKADECLFHHVTEGQVANQENTFSSQLQGTNLLISNWSLGTWDQPNLLSVRQLWLLQGYQVTKSLKPSPMARRQKDRKRSTNGNNYFFGIFRTLIGHFEMKFGIFCNKP